MAKLNVDAIGSVTVFVTAFRDKDGNNRARYAFRDDKGNVFLPFPSNHEQNIAVAGNAIKDAVNAKYEEDLNLAAELKTALDRIDILEAKIGLLADNMESGNA